MNNRIYILLTALCLLIAVSSAHAERKFLNPPKKLTHDPRNYFSPEYAGLINDVKAMAESRGDDRVLGIVNGLEHTLRGDKIRGNIEKLEKEAGKYESDPQLKSELLGKAGQMKALLINGPTRRLSGVDLEIDEKNRKNIFSWKKDDGTEEIRPVPMFPLIYITVKAEYLKPVGSDSYKFYYTLTSDKKSEGDIDELHIKDSFPPDVPHDWAVKKYGKGGGLVFKKDENIKQVTHYPYGYSDAFSMWISGIKDRMGIGVRPGETSKYPYELEQMEFANVGIVNCEMEIAGFHAHGDIYESKGEPAYEVAWMLYRESGEPTYNYRGRTIGPVPKPARFDAGVFIDTIISYNEAAIEEGWNWLPPVVKATREHLGYLRQSPTPANIGRMLSEVEDYYGKKQLEPEAYALLKYNLEYMLGEMGLVQGK